MIYNVFFHEILNTSAQHHTETSCTKIGSKRHL